jgi:hypothetical protein
VTFVTELLVPLAVLGNGLAAGGSTLSVLGGAPLMLSLPAERYVPVHQFLERRMHPFMPACLLVALGADVVCTVLTSGMARLLFAVGAALLVASIAVALTKNVPINRWISTLDAAALPADWERVDPRRRWSRWNTIRAALIMAALLTEVTAVGILLG